MALLRLGVNNEGIILDGTLGNDAFDITFDRDVTILAFAVNDVDGKKPRVPRPDHQDPHQISVWDIIKSCPGTCLSQQEHP